MTVPPTPKSPAPAFSKLPPPPRRRLQTTDRLLVGLLAAVVLLVAAVAALAVVIWVRTEPAPVPTGPTRSVVIQVIPQSAAGTAVLVDASGTSTELVGSVFDSDAKTWNRDVAFGESVEVDLVATTIFSVDNGATGSLNCVIRDDSGILSEGTVSSEGSHAVCRWVNHKP